MELLTASEICAGLVMTQRLHPLAVRPETFIQPYDRIIKDIQKSKEIDITQLAIDHGPATINAALHAAESLNGLGSMANWPKVLEESAASFQAGVALEKMARKLQDGQTIDWGKVASLSRSAQLKLSESLVPLSEIIPAEMPFIPTGMESFDKHTGGVPAVGLVVIGGRPGVGKTWLMTNMTTAYARKYPDKNVAVFSLEMILSEIAARYKGNQILEKSRPTPDEEKRIFISEKPMGADELIQTCTTIPNLGLVFIDFADLMITGLGDENSYAAMYKMLMLGAKELGCTIVLLSQLSRKNGIPKPSDIRYTGLAESVAWMILMLFDPSTDWTNNGDDEDTALPIVDDAAYIIVWKVRGGFRQHIADSPGAILIPFKGRLGWHPTKSRWYSLRKYER